MSGKIFGTATRELCPVCNGVNFENVWKIPMTKVDPALMITGARFELVPLLSSKVIYHFSQCKDCESVFLNPYAGNYWDDGRSDSHHAKKAERRDLWTSYQNRLKELRPYLNSKDMDIVVDVAAGGGQSLTVLKESGEFTFSRMIGLDIMQPSVDWIKSQGFEAYRHDVCKPLDMVGDGSVDLIMFYEAFEHVSSPYHTILNISKKLKMNGVMAMTAQCLEGDLPIRPGESIMCTYFGLEKLLMNNHLEILAKKNSSGRWKIIARKVG